MVKSRSSALAEEPPRFFWVDYEEGKSQKQALARSKHAFLKNKQYQSRRDKKLQNVKSSTEELSCQFDPLANQTSNDEGKDMAENSRDIIGSTLSSEIVLSRSPTVRVLDYFPSATTCLADNPDTYLYHYRFRTSKSTWPFSFRDMSIWFWQKAYEHPALGQVILSTSASQLASTLRLQKASPRAINNATKDTLQFRSQTIKSLQQMLDPTTKTCPESTILVVAHLLCLEAAEANVLAVDAHMHGLKKIVDMLGGLDTLGNETISTVYCCEVMIGVLGFSPRVFPISKPWAARVLSQSTFLTPNNESTLPSSLGALFFNSPWSHNLHPGLKFNLQSLQKLIVYYEEKLLNDSAPESASNDCFIFLVLRMYEPVSECPHVALQESLRLATLVYCMLRIWTFHGLPCLAVLINSLRQSLDHSFSDLELAAPDLLFWILFMGGLASQRSLDSHAWFLERLADVANELSLVSWDGAVHILKGYFFVPRSNDSDAKCLWESVIRARRIINTTTNDV